MTAPSRPEVWLRGPLAGYHPLVLPAAHSLLQSLEEVERVAASLDTAALWRRPGGAASVGFHLRHLAGSVDRLLSYARGRQLDDRQRAALAAEREPGEPPADGAALLAMVRAAVDDALAELRAVDPARLAEPREVGRGRLPSTVWGLLFHVAEHTQRHAGQAVTTAKLVAADASRAPDDRGTATP